MKIIISGGTGFIGQALVREFLGKGHRVLVLSRKSQPSTQSQNVSLKFKTWDPLHKGEWSQSLDRIGQRSQRCRTQ